MIGDVTLSADFVAGIERRAVEAYRSRVLAAMREAHLGAPTYYNAAQKMAWSDATGSVESAVSRLTLSDNGDQVG